MTLATLASHYGLAALLVGAGLEGEAAVVAGGLLAHQGVFSLPGACAASIAGSLIADQLWFTLGRRFRDHRWIARIRAKAAFARALQWLESHPIKFIFGFRFVYGFRTVSPVAIGTSQVSARTFRLVNAVSAIVWGTSFSLIGYVAGNAFERWLGRLHPHGATLWWLVAALVGAGLIAGAVHWWRTRRT